MFCIKSVKESVQNLIQENGHDEDNPIVLRMTSKYGFDGSSNQKQYKQKLPRDKGDQDDAMDEEMPSSDEEMEEEILAEEEAMDGEEFDAEDMYDNIGKMSKPDIQEFLASQNLDASGNRVVLVKRIKAYLMGLMEQEQADKNGESSGEEDDEEEPAAKSDETTLLATQMAPMWLQYNGRKVYRNPMINSPAGCRPVNTFFINYLLSFRLPKIHVLTISG